MLGVAVGLGVVVDGDRIGDISGAEREWAAAEGVAKKGILRECLKLDGDRAVEEVVGDVELIQAQFAQVGDWARELVVFHKQSLQPGQAVEAGRKWA